MSTVFAEDEIRRLPPVLTVVQAAALLGVGRSNAYQAVKAETWPTRVVRVGRCIRIPTADVLQLLGIYPALHQRDSQRDLETRSSDRHRDLPRVPAVWR